MATQKVRKLALGLVLLPRGLGGSRFGVPRLKLPLAKARLLSAPEPVACCKPALAIVMLRWLPRLGPIRHLGHD